MDTHVAHLGPSLTHYSLFFMSHSLQPWQLLHVWQKAFEGSGKRERGSIKGELEIERERESSSQ